MPRLDEKSVEIARRSREERARRQSQPDGRGRYGGVASAAKQGWEDLGTAIRAAGLPFGIGAAGALDPRIRFGTDVGRQVVEATGLPQGPQILPGSLEEFNPGWLPDLVETPAPDVFGAFTEQFGQDDVGFFDKLGAATTAAQEEFDAGPGFWGAAEFLPGALGPTGVPFAAGRGLMAAAPRFGRAAPAARTIGRGLKAPWELEEAAARAGFRGVGMLARGARRLLPGGRGERATDLTEILPSSAEVDVAPMTPDEIRDADRILGPLLPESRVRAAAEQPGYSRWETDLPPIRDEVSELENLLTQAGNRLGVARARGLSMPGSGRLELDQAEINDAQWLLDNADDLMGAVRRKQDPDFQRLINPEAKLPSFARERAQIARQQAVLDDDLLKDLELIDLGPTPIKGAFQELPSWAEPAPRMERGEIGRVDDPAKMLTDPVAAKVETAPPDLPPDPPQFQPKPAGPGEAPKNIVIDVRDGYTGNVRLNMMTNLADQWTKIITDLTHLKIGGRLDFLGFRFWGRATDEEAAMEGATRDKAAVEEVMESLANAVLDKIRTAKAAFRLDKHGRVMNPEFADKAPPELWNGVEYRVSRPFIQDVVARAPLYRQYMNDEQKNAVQFLSDISEFDFMFTKGDGTTVTYKAPNPMLREALGWDPRRVRPDVMDGGAYISRGRAKVPKADDFDDFRETFDYIGERRTGAEHPAQYPSMSAGFENGVVYPSLEEAMMDQMMETARRLGDVHVGKEIEKLFARKGITKEARQASKMRVTDIPGLPKGTSIGAGLEDPYVTGPMAAAIKRSFAASLGERLIRKTNPINMAYKGYKATADFSHLMIQGIFALTRHPLDWVAQGMKSFQIAFRSEETANKIRDEIFSDRDRIQTAKGSFSNIELAARGLSLGKPEFELRLPGVDWLERYGRKLTREETRQSLWGRLIDVPGGLLQAPAQIVRRVNLIFGTYGSGLRTNVVDHMLDEQISNGRTYKELWDSVTPGQTLEDMTNIANNLTGTARGRSYADLGDLLLFARRFFQARFETFSQAGLGVARTVPGSQRVIGKQTIQSLAARRFVLQSVGTMAALTELINAAAGYETDRRPWVNGRPNPNFYRVRLGGYDFSLFGPTIGFFQAITNILMLHPERALRSLGSGFVRLVFDNWTGYTFSGEQAPVQLKAAFFGSSPFRDHEKKALAENMARYMISLIAPIAPNQMWNTAWEVGGLAKGSITGDVPEEDLPGPSRRARMIGGGLSFTTELGGLGSAPLSWKDWQDIIAQDLHGVPYDDVDEIDKAEIDEMVEQQRGEREARGRLGGAYNEKKRITDVFVSEVNAAGEKHLVPGYGSGKYSPPNARQALRNAQDKRSRRIYGEEWDAEKGRFVGGVNEVLFNRDKEVEEPEIGTIDHHVWRWHQLIPNARNKETGEMDSDAWEAYEKSSSKYWADMAGEGRVDEVLRNIRAIEGEYIEPMQEMVNAGRYASLVTIDLLGVPSTYYDIPEHPRVVEAMEMGAQVSRAEALDFLGSTSAQRTAKGREPTKGKRMKDVFDELDRKGGLLYDLRELFIAEAPAQWAWAMFKAGRHYQGINSERSTPENYLRQIINDGKKEPLIDFGAQFRNLLRRQR